MIYQKREKFLVYGSPMIEEDEISEVVDTLRSGWIGTGPKVARFEEAFAKYVGVKHAVALNSCTAGLHLALLALGIGDGDEVITTPLTFCATANVIIHAGAIPVFVDVEKDSMNIDAKKIEEKITSKTKAILPVHFAGRACDMTEIMRIAKKYNLFVVEDCAHAIETKYKGQKTGAIGDIGCFSFYVTKNIVTGEGGMVTTNNQTIADKIKVLALHGMSKDAWSRYSDKGFKHYEVVYPGFKYNMMDLQAAIGIHQLERIEKYQIRRREIWDVYNNAFVDLPVMLPKLEEKDTLHARHLYTILIDDTKTTLTRDEVLQALYNENIGTGVHYRSLHLHEYYRERFGFKRDDFENAAYISDRTLSLPFSAKLVDEDVSDVVGAVRKVFGK